MNIKPVQDKIIVEKVDTEKTTQSGIVLTGSAKEKTITARVIAIHKDTSIEYDIEPCDKIVFSEDLGISMRIEGNTYLVVKTSDILAVIK